MKRIIILASVVFIAILIGVGVFLFFQNSKGPDTSNVPGPVITLPPSLENLPLEDVAIINGLGFTMKYPLLWNLKHGGNDETYEYVVKPKDLEPADYVPSIGIYIYKESANSYVNSRIEKLKRNGFSQSNVNLGGLSGIKLDGEAGYYALNSKIIKSPIQDTIYFLNKGNEIIEVRYRYAGASREESQEDFFNSYLNTFKVE